LTVRDVLAGIVANLQVGRPRNCGSFSGRGNNFSLLQTLKNGCGAYPASRSVGDLRLLSRLRIRGANPPNILRFYDVHTDGFGLT